MRPPLYAGGHIESRHRRGTVASETVEDQFTVGTSLRDRQRACDDAFTCIGLKGLTALKKIDACYRLVRVLIQLDFHSISAIPMQGSVVNLNQSVCKPKDGDDGAYKA